jgi:uncharacterized protein YqiB (DUF1249 family)
MKFIYTFRIYKNIVVNENKELYQLEHFRNKYTYPFKRLTYNENRKAYRINSQWVSKKRLYKFIEKCNIETKELDSFSKRLKNSILAVNK